MITIRKQHAKTIHGNKDLICILCPKTFARKDYLLKHMESCEKKMFSHAKETNCDECEKTFDCSKKLNLHKRNNHGNKKFYCDNVAELSLVMPKFVREEEPGMINKILRLEQEGESIHAKMNRLEAKFRMILNKSQRYWSMLKEYENKLYN